MKKILFLACLLFSLSAHADYIQDWNQRFSELNNVPLNAKWSPSGQQNYLKQLMQARPDYFKNPDDYRLPIAPIPPAPYVPPVVQDKTAKNIINRIRLDLDLLENLK